MDPNRSLFGVALTIVALACMVVALYTGNLLLSHILAFIAGANFVVAWVNV